MFKYKTKIPPFENIELYNVMCGTTAVISSSCCLRGELHASADSTRSRRLLEAKTDCFVFWVDGITYSMTFCRSQMFCRNNSDVFWELSLTHLSFLDLLGLKPVPNNGTHGSLNHLLRNPVHKPSMPEEVSKPTPSGPVNAITDDLGCTCDEKVSNKAYSGHHHRLPTG